MGKSCAFFGHRAIFNSDELRPKLREAVVNLITNHDVDTFLLGEHGDFDRLSYKIINEIQQDYPHISTVLVASYVYQMNRNSHSYDGVDYPEDRRLHPVYAMDKRNQYVVDTCDYVICYVTINRGGAYRAIARARHQKKEVFNLQDM